MKLAGFEAANGLQRKYNETTFTATTLVFTSQPSEKAKNVLNIIMKVVVLSPNSLESCHVHRAHFNTQF